MRADLALLRADEFGKAARIDQTGDPAPGARLVPAHCLVARWRGIRSSLVLLDQADPLREAQRNGVRPRAAVVDGDAQAAGRAARDEVAHHRLPHRAKAMRGGRDLDRARSCRGVALQQHFQIAGGDDADDRLALRPGGGAGRLERIRLTFP